MNTNNEFSVSQKSTRLVVLDSLRGFASILVLYHHIFKINVQFFKNNFNETAFQILNFISDLNPLAVLFFFVLSGFSIGLSLKGKGLNSWDRINEFIYRRLKRILPIYWIALGLAFISGLLMNLLNLPDFSIYTLIGNLLFLQTGAAIDGWLPPYGLNGPLWSLAYELFFYLFFPIAYIINRRYLARFNIDIRFGLLLCCTLLAIIVNKFVYVPYLSFFSLFIIWLLGFISTQTFYFRRKFNLLFTASILVGAFYVLWGYSVFNSNSFRLISKGLIVGSVFYFFTLNHSSDTLLKSGKYFLKGFNFIFFYIGKGSYAIYALHYPILLLLHFYRIPMNFQLIIIAAFVFLCTPLEELTIKLKLSFLKLNYSKIVTPGLKNKFNLD